jgi:VIT1/CCC1 family predicted Fe2+/Mn2+ transporter
LLQKKKKGEAMQKQIDGSFGFGLASGVVTTLGLMIGLYSSTHLKSVVIGGILTIAIADACSDALGIHFFEESGGSKVGKIWRSTILTFFSKFFVALSFLPAVCFLSLQTAVIANIFWSFLLVGVYSFWVSKRQNENPYRAVLEHFVIVTAVIVITYYVGREIERIFG